MNNYSTFSQSFSNIEPIYVYDEELKTVVDSGECRDCQAEIDSYIDDCSSLFLNDFLAEELSPSVDFDDDNIVNVIPGRESLLEYNLRENEVFSDTARILGLDIKGLSLQGIKTLVFNKILEESNKEVSNEENIVEKKVEASIQTDCE